jgi:hypothetical protein
LQLADHIANQKAFGADVAHVVVSQADASPRPLAAGLPLGAAAEENDNIFAELFALFRYC